MNRKLPTEPPVMTVIPWRSAVTQKVHATMAQARRAVSVQLVYNRDNTLARCVAAAKVYVWRDGAWALEHDIAQGTAVEDLPWKKGARR